MGVLSNNSPKEIGICEAKKNAPDHVVKILNIIEEIVKLFTISVKIKEDLTTITLQDKNTADIRNQLRIIHLDVFSKPKSYIMTLYQHSNGVKKVKPDYEIKVIGNYELNTLKSNLEKLIRGKNLSHRPRFYPF